MQGVRQRKSKPKDSSYFTNIENSEIGYLSFRLRLELGDDSRISPNFDSLHEVLLAVQQTLSDSTSANKKDTIRRLEAIRCGNWHPPKHDNQDKCAVPKKASMLSYPHPTNNPNCSNINCYGLDAHYNTERLQKAYQSKIHKF